MIRNRAFLGTCALLAVAAWANVQAMGCCWSLPETAAPHVESSIPSAAAASEPADATDHSCCAGPSGESSSESAASGAPAADCGLPSAPSAALCCEDGAAALASLATAHASTLDAPPAVLYELPDSGDRAFDPVASIVRAAGPPRYLSLRRFLI